MSEYAFACGKHCTGSIDDRVVRSMIMSAISGPCQLDHLLVSLRPIASGMQESGCYVLSPLLFPTRLLWLDFPDDGRALEVAASPHACCTAP
ncbi:MAG TPA: hypothetical protein VMJ11_02285 [Paraburkholderia sp.]|uniref:hypothetical protein n=1 Tax=Paraburkholderia sp. TaxID=1926495 RepID=UPI002D1D726E|nr:hypothetical protein [Paraburkholderia sp.]HTR05496.1 hypothetical protein [Paraburkholderia sp.]